MAVQRLKKGLKAARDKAAQKWTDSLDFADSGRSLHVLEGRRTHEADFNSADRYAFGHVVSLGLDTQRRYRWNC